ncbi:NYN domain-containing protein, partial [Clostridium perfringens]|nr:NYN domain-containing protein [Clostridium perfringens]
AIRLVEVAETCDIVCLVSSDNDYIPVLEYLKRKGKYICTVDFSKNHPIELINLSYMFIDIANYISKT